VEALRAYVSRRQDDWDECTSAITHAHNCRVHSSQEMPPIELVISRPPVTTSMEKKARDKEVAPRPAEREFLERLRTLRERGRGKFHGAQVRYKRSYDRTFKETNRGIVEGNNLCSHGDPTRGTALKALFPSSGSLPGRCEGFSGHFPSPSCKEKNTRL
jgi:hypothetical protein